MQDAEIKLAKANGSYDDCGIIKPHGESIAFRKKEVCTTAYVLPVLTSTLVASIMQPWESDGRHSFTWVCITSGLLSSRALFTVD